VSAAPRSIDTRYTVETAEGARLQLTVAGPVVRGVAWAIDATIRMVVFYGITMAFLTSLASRFAFDDSNGGWLTGVGLLLLLYFALSWLYPIIFEATTGTTPGKRAFRLIVVHDNATPITLGGSVIRNLLRAVDFLPVMYFLGFATCLTDNRFRRLGDLAAGTLVVYRDSTDMKIASFSHPTSAAPPNGNNCRQIGNAN